MLRIKECKHEHRETRNEEAGGYNIPDGCITEYDIYCKDCGEYLGHWAYGSTDLEYSLKTAGMFEKLKFYIKDKISLRKYKKQIKGLDKNSGLPF